MAVYGGARGISHTHVFRHESSAKPNFLIVKNELHSLQRAPTFPEFVWLREKGFEEFFV